MKTRNRARVPIALLGTAAVLAAFAPAGPAWAKTSDGPTAVPAAAGPDTVAAADRAGVLGKDWQHSTDRAWTTSGDATGFHLLVADAKAGYTWRTVATLAEPGLETDQWIGNACVTGSGKRAVVVYAPRSFTDSQDLFDRGGFTAVVDLDTGAVTKLPVNASLAYFDPGCGAGETAVVTQAAEDGTGAQTQLQTVDAAAGKVTATATVDGQATSAVPVGDRIVAAAGHQLLGIASNGTATALATTSGTALRLHPDAGGGVSYLDPQGSDVTARQLSAGDKVSTLAHGKLGQLGLTAGAHGQVFVTGQADSVAKLPSGLSRSQAPAQAQLSTEGGLVINQAAPLSLAAKVSDPLSAPAAGAQPVQIAATSAATGKAVSFTVPTTDAVSGGAGAAPSPLLPYIAGGAPVADRAAKALAQSQSSGQSAAQSQSSGQSAAKAAALSPANDPVDQDRYCSVPRNDPGSMVYQPTPNQVEWAADMAIRGLLTSPNISRPANWHQSGLPAWSPQTMFPPVTLTTGGRIPAQVLLGILAQESNLWQASSHAEPGEYGNPLVGNFYGVNIYPGTKGYDATKIWKINWDGADCGYGIGQATDGMRIAGHAKPGEALLPANSQRAVALDYATGIAYSAEILAEKWNELHQPGNTVTLNNDDPARPENWFAAVWDYNEGFNFPGAGAANWGLGWANNPANPDYPADRPAFLDNNQYSEAAHPQYWSYEEKVMGWGAFPIDTGRSYDDNGVQNSGNTHGYSAAYWSTAANRTQAILPPLGTFCNASNGCDPNHLTKCATPGCYTPYWYHQSSTVWKNCALTGASLTLNQCGTEYLTYKTVRPEPGNADPHPGPCDTAGLPSNAVIVDELADSVPRTRCATRGWTSKGSFSWSFGADESNHYEAKEDLQQIAGGFGSHYWFSHGRQPGDWNDLLKTTGTWTPVLTSGLYQVEAYMPYLGNKTKSAHYQVTTQSGQVYDRVVDQSAAMNGWVTVGYFPLGTNAKVVLTNTTDDTTSGDTTVAYNALAFVPYAGKYVHRTLTAASVFDPNQSLDSNIPTVIDTPLRDMTTLYNWAMEWTKGGNDWDNPGFSHNGILASPPCPDKQHMGLNCAGPATQAAAQAWYNQLVAGGHTPTADGSAPAMSEPVWMGMANPRPDPAKTPAAAFSDRNSYKIKSDLDVTFVVGGDGKIVPGTQHVDGDTLVGNAHLPSFVVNLIKAVSSDYGIAAPDLRYNEIDAYQYSGGKTTAVDPLADGIVPGQAYLPHLQGADIDSTGTCAEVRYVGGGVHGYRSMTAQPSTDANFHAWLNTVEADPRVESGLGNALGDIYSMFFKNSGPDGTNTFGATIGNAPPIWHSISADFCADGTVKTTQQHSDGDMTPVDSIVYQSYMPDLYLYLDGKLVDGAGHPTSQPIHKGDWKDFSNIPGVNSDAGNAYGQCDNSQRGSGGNPWNIGIPFPVIGNAPGDIPSHVVHCDDPLTPFNTTYTP
ncbi:MULTISPECIES: hypothetical protein [unclassified Kitasatospora]|uniref:golvesin C-terminal-like domain-containing protein n=1 Tax=unclassified Kitasatospora TaxID=2633591 RepID=UPI00247551F0|nr:hypothetical protein [Kitasatospora sp. MAP12-44]